MIRESPTGGELGGSHPHSGNWEERVRQDAAFLPGCPTKKVDYSVQGRGSNWGEEELVHLLGNQEKESGCVWWPCS